MVEELSIITPRKSLFDLQLKEVFFYRDLLVLFVKRDIVITYKQTILGPLWFFIQPILTTLMFLVVFKNIAGISTDNIPPVVFYMAGLTMWNYFSESLKLTSDTFFKNANIFGKVYFPRIIMPLSVVLSNLVKFIIQFILFLFVYMYYYTTTSSLHPNFTIFLLPFYIIIIAFLSLSFGLAISALTTKYRDLTFLIQFGIQLWMYATPVIYPISKIPEKYKAYILLNPVTSLIEAFKYSFTGAGSFSISGLIYSSIFALVFFLISLAIFNRTEKTFMDTV
jgi:lipopolysaccharide transport system permease protein